MGSCFRDFILVAFSAMVTVVMVQTIEWQSLHLMILDHPTNQWVAKDAIRSSNAVRGMPSMLLVPASAVTAQVSPSELVCDESIAEPSEVRRLPQGPPFALLKESDAERLIKHQAVPDVSQLWCEREDATRLLFADDPTVTHLRKNAAVFDEVSEKEIWGKAATENGTVSGSGSTWTSTQSVRKCLGEWFDKYNISSLLDFPCGDANWQYDILNFARLKRYTGMDVSSNSIRRASSKPQYQRFLKPTEGQVHVRFAVSAVTALPIRRRHDAVMFRDFIQHIPFDDAHRALMNVRFSGAKYLLVSSFPSATNSNPAGKVPYSPVNLRVAPFFLPEPIAKCQNKDKPNQDNSELLLIDAARIPLYPHIPYFALPCVPPAAWSSSRVGGPSGSQANGTKQ